VSADGRRWFLLNASPDIHRQLERLSPPRAPSELRHVPVEGVVLTDAELDHSLGVVLLREARLLPVYATAAVSAVLERDSRILPLARAFARVPLTELALDAPVALVCRDGSPSGLTVEAFAVPAGPPQFAPHAAPGHTVGLLLRESATGAACAFVPGCGDVTASVLDRVQDVDALLFDGTFWTDRELVDLGIAMRTAREMDHTPVSGPGGSLERLAGVPCRHRVYTHINNSNPMLLEASPERAAVTAAGWTVGFDGLALTL
jgi:pyrroloquinoline quinone biosynthesis protein B